MADQTKTLRLVMAKLRCMAPWNLLNQALAGAVGLMLFGWVGMMAGALVVQLVGLLLALRFEPAAAAPSREAAGFSVVDIVLLPVGVLLGTGLVIVGAAYSLIRALLPSRREAGRDIGLIRHQARIGYGPTIPKRSKRVSTNSRPLPLARFRATCGSPRHSKAAPSIQGRCGPSGENPAVRPSIGRNKRIDLSTCR